MDTADPPPGVLLVGLGGHVRLWPITRLWRSMLPAAYSAGDPTILAANTLPVLINNVTVWIIGLLVGVAF